MDRLEELIKRCDECKMHECIGCDICWSEVQALENLLKRYKELEEENENLKQDILTFKDDSGDCYEMTIEEIMSLHDKCCELKEENNIYKEELEKIDKSLNIEPGTNAPYRTDVIKSLFNYGIQVRKNSIPISVIQNKIDELKPRIEQYEEYSKRRMETDVEFYENIADTAIVQVLQEILEKGNK